MYQTIIDTPKPRKKQAVALWTDIANVSDSGNAIARLVHPKANRRWKEADDAQLIESYKAACSLSSAGYQLGTAKERKKIIRDVAVKLQRSPAAVKIRLRLNGEDLSRKKHVAAPDIHRFISAAIERQA